MTCHDFFFFFWSLIMWSSTLVTPLNHYSWWAIYYSIFNETIQWHNSWLYPGFDKGGAMSPIYFADRSDLVEWWDLPLMYIYFFPEYFCWEDLYPHYSRYQTDPCNHQVNPPIKEPENHFTEGWWAHKFKLYKHLCCSCMKNNGAGLSWHVQICHFIGSIQEKLEQT